MKSRFLIALAAGLLWAGLALATVDINTATLAELDSLKGVGPAKAAAIIDYRRKHGPFSSVDELEKVKGFGAKSVDDLRDEITVGGAVRSLPRVAAKPAVQQTSARPVAPAGPARPASPGAANKASPAAPPPTVRTAAPATPAKPAAPGLVKPVPETKPAAPASSAMARPAGPAPAAPMVKPAAPAVKPAAPAASSPRPAAPAAPARPPAPARPAMAN